MATAVKTPQCRVCHTSHKYGGPDPHLLPCLHSVCQTCLDTDSHHTLTCDICQETFDKEQTDFPPDVVVIKDIFHQTAENDGSAVLCTNRDDGNQAMSWCDECEAFLCEHCQASHEYMKITRSHAVVTLEHLTSADGEPTPKTVYCKEHADHPLQLYDETCKQRICFKCKENHSDCKVNDIATVCQHLKETVLEEGQKGLSKKIEIIRAIRDQVHEVVKMSEVKEEEGKEFLKHTFSELRNTLNQREEGVSLQLDQSFRAVYDINNSRLYKLEMEEAKCDTALGYCQKFAALSSVDALFRARKTVVSRTNECITTELPQVRDTEAAVTLSRQDFTDMKQSISSFGGYYVPMDPQSESNPEGSTMNAMKTKINKLEADNMLHLQVIKNRDQQIEQLSTTMKSVDCVSNVAVHFLPASDAPFPVPLLCIHLKYDKDRVNLDYVHINTEGDLINRKSGKRPAGKGRLKKYLGSSSTAPLPRAGCPQYWEMVNRVSLDKPLTGNRLILEVGVCREEQRDVHHCIDQQTSSCCMQVAQCTTHGGICMRTWKEGKYVLCLPDTLPNTAGSSHTLHYGVVYDDARKKIVFIDVKENKVMSRLDNVDSSQPLWPMFGVYNPSRLTVSMTLVVGSDINMTEEKKGMILRALS
ncbi:uncharacterized protein LOC124127944 isoform X3 [Haliotis rufescens]|uniref:uncharacterized protein LOC124127944 isoform X3 n=1 Tax=Haliotis rufescens TaxID=6454 RepID=UPI00201E81A6|nr:uncharacterized protein LOC124127944 isoform X3 [Haliotis rufescens]